ncbi:MAG: RagB/SusD family nutrient uptake outer membrane protein [Sphingobacterium sp.]|jgi:tetratricopeptide (TPR) repeat protein|uniref:RagB/SusD family nutrient uptake outer membrane protein n=1 Tax=unclassified Sphingobacterium TaxID=2609468 RepID=UPI002840EB75|nr:RagB/SusD family nutrient uptake outer membrane protein [Sphingobacterium sp.]MDR3008277.1 RagB/SusD family nutrient uptake outer membrane protein [Sphingobacterium sp.]
MKNLLIEKHISQSVVQRLGCNFSSTVVLAILSLVAFSSCEKYVDIKTQGQLTPGTIENYRYLLNNTSALEAAPAISDIASDDLEIVDGTAQQTGLAASDYYGYYNRAYQWSDIIYPIENLYHKDDAWNALYNTIAYANTIINEVPTVTDGTDQEKAELIAEAKVHRASAYLMLVNTYAKPYLQATANTDLGVPLVLVPTTEQPLVRVPVLRVYETILNDIQEAIPLLPNSQQYTTLPSKAAAYGMLARTYFYMNKYNEAAAAADQALAINNKLIDLTAMDQLTASNYPKRVFNNEILLSKVPVNGISAYTPTAFRLSNDLIKLFGENDQRYNLFTVSGDIISTWEVYEGRYYYLDYVMNEGRNVGPSVPEMLLIKAEAEARSNKPAAAMALVNQLRAKRVLAKGNVALTATDANDALVKVVQERRREFMFRMLRWWDMRRLKDDPLFQTSYTRTFAGKTVTLTPNSNRYVFPIAQYEINLSPEIVQNP